MRAEERRSVDGRIIGFAALSFSKHDRRRSSPTKRPGQRRCRSAAQGVQGDRLSPQPDNHWPTYLCLSVL